ncbi:MAG: hypothetical protein HY077_06470 [Elusimicrobia bacterium]|nr:hypothetical protein [Elusimicrobiota bacterium]
MGILSGVLLAALLAAPGSGQPAEDSSGAPAPILEIRLMFDDKPLSETTTAQARLWFRREYPSSGAVKPRGQKDLGDRFIVHGLPPGRYLAQASVDRGPEDPERSLGPWEYSGSIYLDYPGAQRADIVLERLTHLTLKPPEGRPPVGGGLSDRACEGTPAFSGKVSFAWESPDPTSLYNYSIRRVNCRTDEDHGEVMGDTIAKTAVAPALNLSLPGERYHFLVKAARERSPFIGLLAPSTGYVFRIVP